MVINFVRLLIQLLKQNFAINSVGNGIIRRYIRIWLAVPWNFELYFSFMAQSALTMSHNKFVSTNKESACWGWQSYLETLNNNKKREAIVTFPGVCVVDASFVPESALQRRIFARFHCSTWRNDRCSWNVRASTRQSVSDLSACFLTHSPPPPPPADFVLVCSVLVYFTSETHGCKNVYFSFRHCMKVAFIQHSTGSSTHS